jgi:CheY-like chemotaxis protein
VPLVEADASQIQQLVMNLIINGAEAIGENRAGTVLVRTGAQELDEAYLRAAFPAHEMTPGDYTYIEVHDDGHGMDEKTKSRIFEPFFTTKFTGRGLGLAAALGIAQAHRGAIRVHSTPGQGSTFTIYLPAIQNSTARSRQKPTVKATVLVVDDEEIVRKVAKSALESYGYEVLLAANGKEALEVFRKKGRSIALVILDLTMPIMAGKETLQHLRAIGEVPVILSSGYNEAEAKRRFAGNALAGFVHKPYTSAEIRARVDAVLAARPPEPRP